MRDLAGLEAHLDHMGRVLLGFSGGVDSSLLAVIGTRTLGPSRFLALTGESASYPAAQWRAARSLAEQFEIPVRVAATAELDDPSYRANRPDRCYFCKREPWGRAAEIACREGFDTVIDGTNADDLGEHRPGLRAAAEHGVRSPLAELGWTKADVRAGARTLGLPIWDAPASPCLSSRIRYGLEVTPTRLAQVEEAEALLRRLGVQGDLRVRHLGERASVEVRSDEFALVGSCWDTIETELLALGFDAVERDARGYRRGGLLSIAAAKPPA
jgi:pyridinium-3,5-biscarboxylic acid mononucleotide sulfurtransferase